MNLIETLKKLFLKAARIYKYKLIVII